MVAASSYRPSVTLRGKAPCGDELAAPTDPVLRLGGLRAIGTDMALETQAWAAHYERAEDPSWRSLGRSRTPEESARVLERDR